MSRAAPDLLLPVDRFIPRGHWLGRALLLSAALFLLLAAGLAAF